MIEIEALRSLGDNIEVGQRQRLSNLCAFLVLADPLRKHELGKGDRHVYQARLRVELGRLHDLLHDVGRDGRIMVRVLQVMGKAAMPTIDTRLYADRSLKQAMGLQGGMRGYTN